MIFFYMKTHFYWIYKNFCIRLYFLYIKSLWLAATLHKIDQIQTILSLNKYKQILFFKTPFILPKK